MRWQKGERSSNIEDRRGSRVPGGRKTKVGGGAIILALLAMFIFGQDPTAVLEQIGSQGGGSAFPTAQGQTGQPRPDDEFADFISAILGETENTWGNIFSQAGSRYPEPVLVLYEQAVRSACGMNTSATGPFYCPGDNKVYIDLSFFRQLERMGAPGDFAIAYVIAHEVGHHIQNVAGTNAEVRRLQQRVGQVQANQLSVKMELQADCFAGIWARDAQTRLNWLDAGDLEEGIRAAAAVGDDRLQEMAGRHVSPESFTHGSSEQRMYWFQRGVQQGNVDACNTFAE